MGTSCSPPDPDPLQVCRPAQPQSALALSMSLHRAKGGKTQTKHTEPNQREGFALCVAAAMQFSKLRVMAGHTGAG